MSKLSTKPLLRGYLHQEAFFVTLGACILLVSRSSNERALIGSIVYSLGLLFLFGFSAVYHRFHWEPAKRKILRRIDHTAIFISIGGTTTPIALLALPQDAGMKLLIVMWAAALAGFIKSVFWVAAPKWLTAFLCVAAGCLSLPYLSLFWQYLEHTEVFLIAGGGIVYSIGALFYAMKKPNFVPGVFGYHELFHLFTIIGAAMHFVVIYRLVIRS